MQCLSTASFHSGWVKVVDGSTITVHINSSRQVELGSCYHVEASAPSDRLQFLTVCVGVDLPLTILQITSTVSRAELEAESRKLLHGVVGTILIDGNQISIEVADVSEQGLGVQSREVVETGRGVELNLQTPHGPIQCLCQVRHCRVSPEILGEYRVGLKILHIDRLSRARWGRILGDRG